MESSRLRKIRNYVKHLDAVHTYYNEKNANLLEYNIGFMVVPDFDKYALSVMSYRHDIPNLNYHVRLGHSKMIALFHYRYLSGLEIHSVKDPIEWIGAELQEILDKVSEAWVDLEETYNIYLEALGHHDNK